MRPSRDSITKEFTLNHPMAQISMTFDRWSEGVIKCMRMKKSETKITCVLESVKECEIEKHCQNYCHELVSTRMKVCIISF